MLLGLLHFNFGQLVVEVLFQNYHVLVIFILNRLQGLQLFWLGRDQSILGTWPSIVNCVHNRVCLRSGIDKWSLLRNNMLALDSVQQVHVLIVDQRADLIP